MPEKPEYSRVPIETIQKFGGEVPFDLFLRLSDDKLVRISNANDDLKELLSHYMEKGVKEIFALKDDYLKFLQMVNKELTTKFFKHDTSPEEKLEILQNSFNVLKASLIRGGVSKISVDLAMELAKKSGEFISKHMLTKEFFNKYKGNCCSEYIRSLFVGSVAVSMLDTLEWKSDTVKEHVMQALLLRDILLSPEDFVSIAQCREGPKNLPAEVYNHPKGTVELLTKDGCRDFSPDVLVMIECHHERPDNKGFPGRVNELSIPILPAMLIVAEEYIGHVIEASFSVDARKLALNALAGIYKKGNYRKAFEAIKIAI
ncbi:MAG: hypothetical protein HYV97_05795 [Bdellovibrio sp.]|nr:hypothetical protein [Bdellovibrio sp.]